MQQQQQKKKKVEWKSAATLKAAALKRSETDQKWSKYGPKTNKIWLRPKETQCMPTNNQETIEKDQKLAKNRTETALKNSHSQLKLH